MKGIDSELSFLEDDPITTLVCTMHRTRPEDHGL